MSGEYLASFKVLLEHFRSYLSDYGENLKGREEAALYNCFRYHVQRQGEVTARALAGEFEAPFERLEVVVASAGDQSNPAQCYKGYGTMEEMLVKCPFAWYLNYLVRHEAEFKRLGAGRE